MERVNTKDVIAFIESNTTGTGEKFVRSALKCGLEVLFLTKNPKKYSFIRKLLIHPVVIDTHEAEKIYVYLKNIPNLRGIISTSENFIYNASIVAQKLSLPCAQPLSIKNCRDKFALIQTLAKVNLPFINTQLINNIVQIPKTLKQFKFPIIVKPNMGTGSIGVKLCYSFDEANVHIRKLFNTDNSITGVLVQDFIQGEEFSAEIIALNNQYHLLGITKKYLGAEPYFVETGHEFPAELELSMQERIFAALTKALQAVGFTFGPVHIEFRLHKKDIYIIEINPRLAGGMIPILIEQSQGIQLIDGLVKLYTGQIVEFVKKTSLVTKIEFFLPEHEGCLVEINGLNEIKKQDKVVDVKLYKMVGDNVQINGDFSDRLGFIITKGKDLNECRSSMQIALDKLKLVIDPISKTESSNISNLARDRLSVSIEPRVKMILSEKSFHQCIDFQLLSAINKAHVLMLEKCKIISIFQAELLANAIIELEDNNFSDIAQRDEVSVGYYLSYEQALINKLGIEVAGNLHIGRSRNDINATIQRLKSRQIFINLLEALWSLRSQLLQTATDFFNVTMPIYSQFQPAMPATYAYYLLAVEGSLAANQHNLEKALQIIDTSPLGASAGAGTIFPIDPMITAKLLGFKQFESNALLAVASRDLELILLSCGALLGVTISRIAQDYQLWSTNEFSFIEIPDKLCGISSVMPQKKNPYLLEKIKGKAISISGTLASALATMHKTPFTNSVEVGTEALINYNSSIDELIRAIKLLEIIISEAKPIQKNMQRSNIEGLTVATAVAELLVKNNSAFSYRQAHGIVGKTIANALKEQQKPLDEILKLTEDIPMSSDEWHLLYEYGNGPGENSTKNMLSKAIVQLNIDGEFLCSKINQWEDASASLAVELEKLKISNQKIKDEALC